MPESITQRGRQQAQVSLPGELLAYADLVMKPLQFGVVAAALSRLSREGLLARYAQRQYYRPQPSRFGPLRSREGAILRTPSPDGVSHNQLGPTIQVPVETMVTKLQSCAGHALLKRQADQQGTATLRATLNLLITHRLASALGSLLAVPGKLLSIAVVPAPENQRHGRPQKPTFHLP